MEGKYILTTLKKSLDENIIISVFWNRNSPSKCSCGFIEKITNTHIAIKHISVDGFYDGYKIGRLDDVYRVDIGGEYEERLLYLYNLRKQSHADLIKGKVDSSSNLFKEALINAKKRKMVVRICIDETEEQDNIVGWVKSLSDSEVLISTISSSGENDGESCFYIDEIITIDCDTEDESVIALLNQRKR